MLSTRGTDDVTLIWFADNLLTNRKSWLLSRFPRLKILFQLNLCVFFPQLLFKRHLFCTDMHKQVSWSEPLPIIVLQSDVPVASPYHGNSNGEGTKVIILPTNSLCFTLHLKLIIVNMT